jgi:hypothetical protein
MKKSVFATALAVVTGLGLPLGVSAQEVWTVNSPGSALTSAPTLVCSAQAWSNLSQTAQEDCRDGTGASCPFAELDLSKPGTSEVEYLNSWQQCMGDEGQFLPHNKVGDPVPSTKRADYYASRQQDSLQRTIERLGDNAGAVEPILICQGSTLPSFQGCQDPNLVVNVGSETCGELSRTTPPPGVTFVKRPDGVDCPDCAGLPNCLFMPGGGNPAECGNIDACGTIHGSDGNVLYSASNIQDFAARTAPGPNNTIIQNGKAQVVTLLDDRAKANFEAIAAAKAGLPPTQRYCNDISKPACRGRDPAYWGYQALSQQVLRSWSQQAPIDIMLVLDRSGSMYYDPSTTAIGERRVDQATDAAKLFATMMAPKPNGDDTSRIGLVSFGTEAGDTTKNAQLADVTVAFQQAFRDVSTNPFETALSNIENNFVDAATSIGAGMDAAATALCGGEACEGNKAFVLLTDGLQNTAPCIHDESGTSRCSGPGEFDMAKLGSAKVCAIGFGSGADIDTHALTALTDGRGKFYQRDGTELIKGTTNDLGARTAMLETFAACAGDLLATAPGSDPKGIMDDDNLAAAADHYDTCGDQQLMFVGGWGERGVNGDEMHLLVNDPDGNLVRPNVDGATGLHDARFSVTRVDDPQFGTWRTQIIRHHTRYVNGFTPDAFADIKGQGLPLVRRQIQRLCPNGCDSVLHYEETPSSADSVYDLALEVEKKAGLVRSVTRLSNPHDLRDALDSRWDLIIFVNATADRTDAEYDEILTHVLCNTSVPAIYTDTRLNKSTRHLHYCSGALPNIAVSNYTEIRDSDDGEKRLVDGTIQLKDPGVPVFSYGVGAWPWDDFEQTDIASEAQARNPFDKLASTGGEFPTTARADAIVATSIDDVFGGVDSIHDGDGVIYRNRPTQAWFSEIHFKGLSRIEAPQLVQNRLTGHGFKAQVGVPLPYLPKGGFTSAKASVRIEYPLKSTGQQVIDHGCSPDTRQGDSISSRENAVSPGDIPTAVMEVALNDDGVNGDSVAHNFQWSAEVPSLGEVDGIYALRYAVDFTYTDASGRSCTQHREAFDTVTMEPELDANASVISNSTTPTGRTITFTPQDEFGNPLGCGVSMHPTCDAGCECAQVFDHGDGSYTVTTKGPVSLGCNCFSVLGEQFCAGPKIVAPDVTADVCVESATEVLLDVKVTNGTATGRVLDKDGTPSGDLITTDDPRVLVPVGVTKIQWTVTDGSASFNFVQTVTVREGSDKSGNCCPTGTTLLTGTDYSNFYYLPNDESYCVLGLNGADSVTTGPLHDVVFGGEGGDFINNNSQGGYSAGGEGDDSIVNPLGGALHGGAGQDFMYSCSDSDLWGNLGDDAITASAGTNHIYPNAGRDVVTGGTGSDTVTLFDLCELTAGKVLDGGPGKDTLVTPVPVARLLQMGVIAVNFEKVVVRNDLRYLAQCK